MSAFELARVGMALSVIGIALALACLVTLYTVGRSVPWALLLVGSLALSGSGLLCARESRRRMRGFG